MTLPADVYAQVPDVACRGMCQQACGPVACSALEADAMRDNGVAPPEVRVHPALGPLTCSHLSDEGRCAIYEHRPLVCRLWGAVRAMPCAYGCKPRNGYLSDIRAGALFARLDDGRAPHFPAVLAVKP